MKFKENDITLEMEELLCLADVARGNNKISEMQDRPEDDIVTCLKDADRTTMWRRMETLVEHELVLKDTSKSTATYTITKKGLDYLDETTDYLWGCMEKAQALEDEKN